VFRRLLAFGFSAAVVVLSLLPGRPLLATGLLHNGSFEEGFHRQAGITGEVPDGWQAVNLSGNPTLWSTQHFADGGWVEKIDGSDSVLIAAEDYYPRGLPFETVYFQTIEGVAPGQPYSLTGWVLLLFGGSAWPDNHGGQTIPPDPYSLGAWVGIDPTGGTDPQAASVEWGENTYENYAFINLRAASVARAGRITLFVRLLSKWEQSATTVILDGFNLQPAPQAIVEPLPVYSRSPVTLHWQEVMPQSLSSLGNFALFFDVQRQLADGTWSTVAKELRTHSYTLEVANGERVTLRVSPRSWQPTGQDPRYWPPSRFYGVPSAPTTTIVDLVAPIVSVDPLPATTKASSFTVSWSGSDSSGGSGIELYDVQYRFNGGPWIFWQRTPATSATFVARENGRYEFEARGVDKVENFELFVSQPEAGTLVTARLPALEQRLWLPIAAHPGP